VGNTVKARIEPNHGAEEWLRNPRHRYRLRGDLLHSGLHVAVDRLRYLSGGKLDIIAINALSINTYAYAYAFAIVECTIKLLELYIKRYNAEHHIERHNESDEYPDIFDNYSHEFNEFKEYHNEFNKCPEKFDHCLDKFDEPFDLNRS
jgi:hypothetical protein